MPYKIVVLIKQTPDMNAVRVDRASGQVQMTGQPVISSHDASALEAAIQLKEAQGGEVTVISAGPASVKDALQRALGMGADKAVHVAIDDLASVDTLSLARLLADQIKPLEPDLIFAGQTSDDGGSGQVGPQVAEILGLPKIGSISALSVEGDQATVGRDSEDGRQTVEAKLPLVLMIQSGLNEPRYPSLKGMMAAKKKPTDVVAASPARTAGIDWSQPYAPARTSSGTIVQGIAADEAAAQLVDWLKERKLI
jgi:electron transfer flavoprotein beta subunit